MSASLTQGSPHTHSGASPATPDSDAFSSLRAKRASGGLDLKGCSQRPLDPADAPPPAAPPPQRQRRVSTARPSRTRGARENCAEAPHSRWGLRKAKKTRPNPLRLRTHALPPTPTQDAPAPTDARTDITRKRTDTVSFAKGHGRKQKMGRAPGGCGIVTRGRKVWGRGGLPH